MSYIKLPRLWPMIFYVARKYLLKAIFVQGSLSRVATCLELLRIGLNSLQFRVTLYTWDLMLFLSVFLGFHDKCRRANQRDDLMDTDVMCALFVIAPNIWLMVIVQPAVWQLSKDTRSRKFCHRFYDFKAAQENRVMPNLKVITVFIFLSVVLGKFTNMQIIYWDNKMGINVPMQSI